MLIEEVFLKYHKKTPFPWTITSLLKAGVHPLMYAIQFGFDIRAADDAKEVSLPNLLEELEKIGVYCIALKETDNAES